MVSLVNFHTNATLKRWHPWEIDLSFALKMRFSRAVMPSDEFAWFDASLLDEVDCFFDAWETASLSTESRGGYPLILNPVP